MQKDELFRLLNNGIESERLSVFARNIRKNLPMIKLHGGLAPVAAAIDGMDIIICGAAPSLEKNLTLLMKCRSMERVCIICADMSAKVLFANGIVPDYVMTCESTPKNYFAGFDSSSSHLLAFCAARPCNLRPWRGRVSFYNWMVNGAYEPLWETSGKHLGSLATGSTIITQALSLAFGVNPASVCLVGNDLAYRYEYYARGCVSSDEVAFLSRRCMGAETIVADKVRRARRYFVRRGGREFFTHHQFLAAKYWIEDLMGKSRITLLECSVPGCGGQNILNIDFEKYVRYLEGRK